MGKGLKWKARIPPYAVVNMAGRTWNEKPGPASRGPKNILGFRGLKLVVDFFSFAEGKIRHTALMVFFADAIEVIPMANEVAHAKPQRCAWVIDVRGLCSAAVEFYNFYVAVF